MRVIIAGDFSPRLRLSDIIGNRYFEDLFGDLVEVFKSNDLKIVNFETTIADPSFKSIDKIGARLKTTSVSIDALKYLGINLVTLANNHAFDYGLKGLKHTFNELQVHGIDWVGAGFTLKEASKPFYKNINGESIAIINCCEHEYGYSTESSGGTNPLNPVSQFYSILEAKKNADYVIVIVHGGHEHFQLPSLRMQETYRYFIDLGADAVINHHQHCYSGMEYYKGKPIFYGLGNFAFDIKEELRTSKWCEGILVELNMEKNSISCNVIPYSQFDKTPRVQLLKNRQNFDQEFEKLSDIISNRSALSSELNKYYDSCQRNVFTKFQPWPDLCKGAFFRGFLPSLVSKQSLAWIQNWVVCESHLEKLIYFLNKNARSSR